MIEDFTTRQGTLFAATKRATMVEPSSQLVQWLRRQESEGTLESSGQFTLDRSKAWEKLGGYQLPFLTAWVLKVVQAANARPHSEVVVTQEREATTFLVSAADHWSRATVEAAVFNLHHECPRDVGHLAVGLRSLAQLKTRPFSVRYSDGSQVAWDGSSFHDLEPDAEDGSFSLTVAHFEFGESSSIFSLTNLGGPKYLQEINSTLCCRCHLGPRSLKVDGREIIGFYHDPNFGVADESRPLAVLRTPVTDGLPTFEVFNPRGYNVEKVGDHQVSVDFRLTGFQLGQPAQPQATLSLLSVFVKKTQLRKRVHYYAPSEASSEIIWWNDGVVVAREPLPGVSGPVGVGIVLSCEGLATDVSGLLPRESDEKDSRRNLGIQSTVAELERLVESLGDELIRVEKSGGGVHAVRGILGLAVAVLMPIFGLPLIAKAIYDHSAGKRRAETLDQAFDQGLRHLVKRLKERESISRPG